MKNFRTLFSIASIVTIPLAQGAAFFDDFSGLTPGTPGQDLNTYNGWTQSEPNPISGTEPLAWGQTVGGTNGFGLGAGYGAPTNDPFSASHGLSLGFANSALTTTFVVVDSDALFPDRNDYSIGIFNGSGVSLFRLDITATGQPGPGTADDQWNVAWNSGASNNAAFAGVIEDGLYDLTVNFVPNGANIDFTLTLSGGVNSFGAIGTLTGLAAQTVTEYRVSSLIGTGSDWGNGFIGIKGVGVPEPSSALLFVGLGALGLARRRRA